MISSIMNKIALALDNTSDQKKIQALIDATVPWVGIYKIGLEQFVRFGPPILEIIRKVNRKIFLDLKLHDIPNTVAHAVHSACDLGVDYLTIHTQGGVEMMSAAMKARKEHSPEGKPAIIGVTLLTSIGAADLRDKLKVTLAINQYVAHLSRQAVLAGIDGIVCSAADLADIAPVVPDNFKIITPGIRLAGSAAHDQKRIASPAEAIKGGATIIVVGRAVTAADDPGLAARQVYDEIASSM